MRCAGALVVASFAVVVASASESPTSVAQEHVRKACELIWAEAAPYKVQRCTERAMAALGEHERLRYGELTRLLVASDTELESCRAELSALRGAATDTEDSTKH